jgi:hypothetical protein
LKLAAGGLGFKDAATGTITTRKTEEFDRILWIRCARDYQLRVMIKEGHPLKFEGLAKEVVI